MIQRTQAEKAIWGVVFRILFLPFAFVVGGLLSRPLIDIIKIKLNYQNPPLDVFNPFNQFTGDFLGIIISCIFWIAIFYGALGKKIDYVLIGIFAALAILLFATDKNMSFTIFAILILSILFGNLIGYLLKLGRQRLFPGWK